MKAQIGDYIRTSVKDADGVRRPLPLKVVRIDGDPSEPKTDGYELEDGSLVGNWEIGLDDVLLESQVMG